MLSRSVSFMSQLVRNSVLFISQICLDPKWLRLNCEGSATSSRWVRDTRDHFATILRGILSHKIFEHVQNFRDYFAPLGDTCEEITNQWRLFRDYFASNSRCLSPVVAKQSQSSEIGALCIRANERTNCAIVDSLTRTKVTIIDSYLNHSLSGFDSISKFMPGLHQDKRMSFGKRSEN